jgi:hypothetical protein
VALALGSKIAQRAQNGVELEAANVHEAVTIPKAVRTVALVISDIRMPGGGRR